MARTTRLLGIFLLTASFAVSFAQTGQDSPRRRKPTAELAKLNPLLGSYTTVMERNNQKLPGTMEIHLVVGGWYIERINYTKSEDGKIDSEIRSMITWDPTLGYYRIWRFVQLTPQRKHDGIGRFEGETFIEEYEYEPGDKDHRILRNRITMVGKDEMRIVNEIQGDGGKVSLRGVIAATRSK